LKIEKIGLITYHYRHLKTEQVLLQLLNKKLHYEIFALPFKERKPREILINHRPNQTEAVCPEDIANKYKIPYHVCQEDSDIFPNFDVYLILGANILSPECVRGKNIINCHPGIIPSCRGLDSFKWAIYEMKPLGVTLHYIDENVDAGKIISVVPTPVFESDSILTLARRHYENEINTLINFDFYLNDPKNPFENIEIGEPKKRMKKSQEQELFNIFPKYKEKYKNVIIR
jgi:phosphoribosylglycinamide formyltransferase-1